MDSHFDRTLGNAELVRRFGNTETDDFGQDQDLSVLFRQQLQQPTFREFAPGCAWPARLGQNFMVSPIVIDRVFPRALPTQGIYGLVAHDGKQPGPERPLRIVGVASLMNGNQGFLNAIFNEMVVAETAPQAL